MANNKDNKTGSGNHTLNDVMGTDKASEEAGSGKTAVFNLDDIDIDEEIDISDIGEAPVVEEGKEEFSSDDLEFGEDEEEKPEPQNKHNEMPIPGPDSDNSLDLDVSGDMDLDMGDDDMDLEGSDSSGKSLQDSDQSMEMELTADDDESYEAAPENKGDLDLSGEELFEQSQSSIKTGGAALKKPLAKTPVVQKQAVQPPEKNAKPRKPTKEHNPNCNFCKIALRRFKLMTIYEDDSVIAIMDPKPLMKGQVLICSKTHKSSLSVLTPEENAHFFHVAKLISDGIKESKIPADGVSYFLSESVNEAEDLKHVYMSLIPRKPQDGIGLKFSKKNAASSDDLELIGDHLIQFL